MIDSIAAKFIGIGAVSCVGFLASCERSTVATSPPPAAPETSGVTEIKMQNMQFSPATIEITKGTTVDWKNEDLIPHTATSPVFGDSGPLNSGDSWQHTFSQQGEFPYVCTFHPTMTGTVIVK